MSQTAKLTNSFVNTLFHDETNESLNDGYVFVKLKI